MGMAADIIAIGPFNPDIVGLLNYPPEFYRATRPGTEIAVELFGILEGSSASRQFAAYLGISDPWDFNQHKILASRIDMDGLRAFFKTLRGGEDYAHDLEALAGLAEHGFELYFRPNG